MGPPGEKVGERYLRQYFVNLNKWPIFFMSVYKSVIQEALFSSTATDYLLGGISLVSITVILCSHYTYCGLCGVVTVWVGPPKFVVGGSLNNFRVAHNRTMDSLFIELVCSCMRMSISC